MPVSLLFAINNEGRIYTLSTSGSMWRELQYVGQEFKKLSAVPHFLWAVGGDHQVYVYVHGLDIPIRVKEESYENERWLPLEGFSSRLLPTDRYHFSSVDGLVDRAIDKIRLPSMAWQWEGDWHLDTTLDGQPLDHTGWSYAVDFPAQYHAQKQWKSCVRRRKWIRYRRYSAMNSWCAIAPLHKDPTQEPFIDVSIGGQAIPGGQSGVMLVWAVTAQGRVMFRTGVSTTSPEGLRWTAVPLPQGAEVNQLSVGPTGLVWALLLSGRALVRYGVSRDSLTGESWVEVRPPGDNLRLVHVSVGTNAVWAVSNDKRVWFRKGVKGDAANISEDMAIGSGWVEMVGNMAYVSVAPNDQVWAVGSEDRSIYFRTGVTNSELTGKKWRMVQAAMQLSRASSCASLASNQSHHRHSLSGRDKHRSWTSLNRPHSTYEPSSLPARDFEEQSRSAPTPTSLRLRSERAQHLNESQQSRDSVSEGSENGEDVKNATQPEEITGKHFETTLKNPKAWSPVRSVGSVVGTEAHPETDCSVWDADLTRDSGVYGDDDDAATLYWAEFDAMWSWVEAGACHVEPAQQLANWFIDVGGPPQADLNQPWRVAILDELRSRIPPTAACDFEKYENAVETSSWIRTDEARCLLPADDNTLNTMYEDCVLQLEWIGNSGTFTMLHPDGATTKYQFSLGEVTCVVCCSEPGNPRIAVHIPNLCKLPLKLQFGGDTDMEDWMANLTSVCCQVNEVQDRPSNNSMWITTALGDVFVFDPITMELSQQQENMYVQHFDVLGKETPQEIILHNGCKPGTIIEMTGCVHDDADRLIINLSSHPVLKLRHKAHSEIRFVPLHFNPRFSEDIIVRNSMNEGEWGTEEREGGMPLQTGHEFTMTIACEEDGYKISIDNKFFTFFNHRLPMESVYKLEVSGKVRLFKVTYQCSKVIIPPRDMFWRQMGGHLRRVETCTAGVTWGIGYDHTAWVYTGGWGGAFLKGLESSSQGIFPMTDTQDYLVYENQRWNPLTGYTSTGLPTDRYMWSDVTGKHKRTREHAKLISMHWHWVSDWIIDFHTPGGVDKDGWQYAVDFPATYHAHKHFTDYVRRRRWYRRCAIGTTGPWQELGNTKILDVSMQPIDDTVDCLISVWAIAAKGDAIFRRGVSQSNPTGSVWEHIAGDQPFCSISCGPDNQVWAIGRNGSAYRRTNISTDKPQGEIWQNLEPPAGVQLKQISVGTNMIWALDNNSKLYVRKEITNVFPEGTHWQVLTNDPSNAETTPNTSSGIRDVSAGRTSVWAITNSGFICRRCGITAANPAGTGWDFGIGGNFHYVSARGLY